MTDEIRAEIELHGPIPFERFMDRALYGEQGFYMRPDGGSAGRRGDFITSPEVGPLFGALLARYIDGEWERLGRPDPFAVVDVGAGPGTLARAILAARPACFDALRYVAVEVSAVQRQRHPDGVESRPDVPTARVDGVVIANELLDNLPYRLAVFDAGWREAFVDVDRDGRFIEVLSAPFDKPPAALPPAPPVGARAPLVDRAARMVDALRIVGDTLVVVDYAVARTADLTTRPWRDWLRTYRANERGEHYLSEPGSQDITTDVPLDQLPPSDVVRTQAQFLERWGIDDLVAEGIKSWNEQAARPGLEAMRMRSRVSESEALLDPTGLGSFLISEWHSAPDDRSGGR